MVLLLLQLLWWHCIECVIHDERDVRKEQQYNYIIYTNANKQ